MALDSVHVTNDERLEANLNRVSSGPSMYRCRLTCPYELISHGHRSSGARLLAALLPKTMFSMVLNVVTVWYACTYRCKECIDACGLGDCSWVVKTLIAFIFFKEQPTLLSSRVQDVQW